MAKYDFQKAKRIIEEKKDSIKEASLGMHEDWFWTADTVFEDGEHLIDLDTVEKIAGIDGSYWATPTLQIEYKDGTKEAIPCYEGEKPSGINEMGAALTSGVFSSETQANRPELKENDENEKS
jgi:hypothetical protein